MKSVVKVTWGTPTKFLEKAGLAKTVGANIKAQPSVFPNPGFDPVALIKAGEALDTAYQTRLNGPVAKSEFHDADHAVDLILYTAADFVNTVSDGVVLVIDKSGFTPVSSVRTPAQLPGKSTLSVKAFEGGILDLQASKVDGYESYGYIIAWGAQLPQITIINHQFQISGSVNYVIIPAGHIHEKVGSIAPAGTQVTCWCFAQNAAGIGPLSNPVGDIFLQK